MSAQDGASIRIVLADEHRVIRAALHLMLDRHAGLSVVDEAADVVAARRSLAVHRPDVLVLDGRRSTAPAIAELRSVSPRTAVVVLTTPTVELTGAGAATCVPADAGEPELVAAIQAAARARGPDVVRAVAPTRRDDLSARELEVLGLIALGHTNGEIAQRLFLSVRTVESHRARIQQKTGRGSRAELVAYAREHGLA